MTTPEEVQWRNIRKVVRALADHCFGSKDDPKWGVAWIALVNSLTAKDGVKIELEPLPGITKTRIDELFDQEEAKQATVIIPDSKYLHSTVVAEDEPKVSQHDLYFFRVGWNAYRNALLTQKP